MSPNHIKKLLYFTLTLVIIGFLSVALYQEYQNNQAVAKLDADLLLRVTKEDIASFRENPPAGLGQEPVISYAYATNQVVGPTTYKGYQEDLTKRTPTAQQFLISKNTKEEKYVGKFYAGVQFMKKGDQWYQTATATTTKSAFLAQTKLTLLDHTRELFGQPVLADTFYSGAGDGHSGQNDSDWPTAHDDSVGIEAFTDYTSTTIYFESNWSNLGNQYIIYRAFLPFDTSAISSGETITDATLNIYVTSAYDQNNDGYDYINIVQTNQPDSTALTIADYNKAGATTSPTVGDDENNDITNIAIDAYLEITLNSTGRGWIKKSGQTSNCGTTAGYTCLGLREGHDLSNQAIPALSRNTGIGFSSSDYTGTSQDPYLLITYISSSPALKLDSGKVRIDSGKIIINSN